MLATERDSFLTEELKLFRQKNIRTKGCKDATRFTQSGWHAKPAGAGCFLSHSSRPSRSRCSRYSSCSSCFGCEDGMEGKHGNDGKKGKSYQFSVFSYKFSVFS